MGIGIICCEKPKEEQMKLNQPNTIIENIDKTKFKNNDSKINEEINSENKDYFELTKNSKRKNILKNNNPKNNTNITGNNCFIENEINSESIKNKCQKSSNGEENLDTNFFSNFNNLQSQITPKSQNKDYILMNNVSNNDLKNSGCNINNIDYSNFTKLVFFIESFELTYKKYDDYGLTINPMIYMKTDAAHEAILDKQNENDFEGCKTLTNTLTENISFNNTEIISKTVLTTNTENINTNIIGVVKNFNINSSYSLTLENYENWKYKILRIKIFNKSKSSQYNPIIIGICAFPLISIPFNGVEGKIPVRNKLTKNIGNLNIRMGFLQKDGTFFGKYSPNFSNDFNNNKSKKLENDEIEFDDKGINTNFYLPIETSENIPNFENYKNTFLNYENIDHTLKEKFKIKKSDPTSRLSNEEKLLESVNLKKIHLAIINEITLETSIKKISSHFTESISNGNHIVFYGLLKFLVDNFENLEKNYLDELFSNLLSTKKSQSFFNSFEDLFKSKNYYLSKLYFYLIQKIIIFYKNSEIKEGNTQNHIINFEDIFVLIVESLIYLYKSAGDIKSFSYENLEEFRETVYWIYSCIIELITHNPTENFKDKNSILNSNFIYFNNSLKIINDPKSIIDVFIMLNEDSEITGFVSRIFRKCIQNILDDINIYPKISDKNELINSALKNLILDFEKAQKFISFVQICLMRYINYPEIYSNVLLIIICLCNDNKYPEVIRTLLDNIDISLICSGFDIYRGNLKKIGKNINYFFYKLLSQLISNSNFNNSALSTNKSINTNYNYTMNRLDKVSSNSSQNDDSANNICLNIKKHELKEICNEISKLFRLKTLGNGKTEKSKTLVQFLKNKNLELHEILCCIAANITKNSDSCINICRDKCIFVNNILEFFLELNKKYFEKNLEKYKNQRKEKIPLYLSVIDNSLIAFINILTKNATLKDYFFLVLKQCKFDSNLLEKHIRELIEACLQIFNLNENNYMKIKLSAENLLHQLK